MTDKFEFPSTWPGLMSNEHDLNERELRQESLDNLPITETEIMDRAISILEEDLNLAQIGTLSTEQPDQTLQQIALNIYSIKAEQELIAECRGES